MFFFETVKDFKKETTLRKKLANLLWLNKKSNLKLAKLNNLIDIWI